MKANEPMKFDSVDSLHEILRVNDIYTVNYGWGTRPGTKSIENLFEEIKSDQCQLVCGEDERLKRNLFVSRVIVKYKTETLVEIFKEEETERHSRLLEMKCSLTEQLSTRAVEAESFFNGACRAFSRLGLIVEKKRFVTFDSSRKEESPQHSIYPGLATVYNYCTFKPELVPVELQEVYFVTEGDQKTYFCWFPNRLVEILWSGKI